MNFIKYLKSLKSLKNNKNSLHNNHSYLMGQASVEYIILTVVLIGLLSVWLSGLFPDLRDNLKTNFFDKAVARIVSDSGNGGGGGNGGDDDNNDDDDYHDDYFED